jgi:hypothetical protein
MVLGKVKVGADSKINKDLSVFLIHAKGIVEVVESFGGGTLRGTGNRDIPEQLVEVLPVKHGVVA